MLSIICYHRKMGSQMSSTATDTPPYIQVLNPPSELYLNKKIFPKPIIFGFIWDKTTPFILMDDIIYFSKKYKLKITIKKGMKTDGLSNLRALYWWASPFKGRYVVASTIHDGLYHDLTLPRNVCDDILSEVMCCSQVNRIKAKLLWAGVRIGGWVVYYKRKYRKYLKNFYILRTKTPDYKTYVNVEKLNDDEYKALTGGT